MTRWVPDDNFYQGYSLLTHLIYGSDGERDSIDKTLENLGVEKSDGNAQALANLMRDCYLLLHQDKYSQDLKDLIK